HDHLFAVNGGQGGNTQVDNAHGGFYGYPAILRAAAVGDVQLGHHLDARYHRHQQIGGNMDFVLQHAVDAVTNHQGFGSRVYVNVAGPKAQGFQNDGVHQPDGRGLLGTAQQLFQGFLVGFIVQDNFDALVRVVGADLG